MTIACELVIWLMIWLQSLGKMCDLIAIIYKKTLDLIGQKFCDLIGYFTQLCLLRHIVIVT